MTPIMAYERPKITLNNGTKRSMIAFEYGGPKHIAPIPINAKRPMVRES